MGYPFSIIKTETSPTT